MRLADWGEHAVLVLLTAAGWLILNENYFYSKPDETLDAKPAAGLAEGGLQPR